MLEKSPRGHVLCCCCCLALELSISREIPALPQLRAAHRAFTAGSHCSPGSRTVHSLLTAAVQAPSLLRLGAAFIYTAAAPSKQAKNKKACCE